MFESDLVLYVGDLYGGDNEFLYISKEDLSDPKNETVIRLPKGDPRRVVPEDLVIQRGMVLGAVQTGASGGSFCYVVDLASIKKPGTDDED